jgi:hypothetical protein
MSFTQVTVTATLLDNTTKGYITFVPTASISNGGVQAPILPKTLTLTAGTGSLVLNAGDDVGTSPSGSGYVVTEHITGAPLRTYVVQLSKNATAVSLGSLAPSTATPFYSYVQTTQLGAASGVATLGADGILTLAQRPAGGGAHAATHAAGGTDPVTITEAQVTGLTADLAAKASLGQSLVFALVFGV